MTDAWHNSIRYGNYFNAQLGLPYKGHRDTFIKKISSKMDLIYVCKIMGGIEDTPISFRYEGKENSMEFMNGFLDDEAANMRQFLNLISSPPPDDWIHGLNTGSEKVDFNIFVIEKLLYIFLSVLLSVMSCIRYSFFPPFPFLLMYWRKNLTQPFSPPSPSKSTLYLWLSVCPSVCKVLYSILSFRKTVNHLTMPSPPLSYILMY